MPEETETSSGTERLIAADPGVAVGAEVGRDDVSRRMTRDERGMPSRPFGR